MHEVMAIVVIGKTRLIGMPLKLWDNYHSSQKRQ